ncbi:ABC transporter ATP-binding protein [Microtetraspora sp. NBRC 16547]|uniref:ATP-binding cassette domain-containing protein n=1 Tax=Microtetraspora sp. NBRC 16547 TaxID=3030993 RepID=UPI0024A2653A|nr:ABC transporter ATP-binding protein [Microtetraspora sp. NBRC 16547]GLX01991.1 ABC transporter [Microtetraspora sp. NBRC 16547]
MRVEVEDLVLRYDDVTALDRLTFSLEESKIYGLLGRNGSGKTSLLSILAAVRRQSAGRVRIDGQPVFENAALTPRISLVRDTGEAITIGTVEDALYFAEWLRPNWDADYAAELLELFGITPKMSIGSMSTGQRSAMGVVVGLAGRAPLTMFDEAYLGMDAPSRQAFYDALLADYIAHPRTIILSTHLIQEVGPLFEEVLIIDRGRLLVQEDTQTLLSRGATVIGPTAQVDAFTADLTVLGTRRLGPTTSATVYGEVDEGRRRQATEAGLELGPIDLQDLFVHLTGENR